jgi:hypothetical protein
MARAKKVKSEETVEPVEGSGVDTELEEMESDSKGNTFLPGTAPVVVKELIDCAKEIELVLKPDFGRARDALVAANDTLADLAHKHIDLFSEADASGTRVYKVGGVIISITFEKEKIKTKLVEDIGGE